MKQSKKHDRTETKKKIPLFSKKVDFLDDLVSRNWKHNDFLLLCNDSSFYSIMLFVLKDGRCGFLVIK